MGHFTKRGLAYAILDRGELVSADDDMPSLTHTRVALLSALLAIGACDDVTARTDPHPAVGTWDVTLQLDTFVYEYVGSEQLAECSGQGLYCRLQRPTRGASLSGSVVVEDSVISRHSEGSVTLRARGTFTGWGCTQVDVASAGDGCRQSGPIVGEYSVGTAFVCGSDCAPAIGVFTRMPGEYTPGVILEGQLSNDGVMTGTVRWELSVGRTPPHYRGTFTARRRRS